MGELIDLRLVFEEKRILDATVRIERCSTELLVKALGQSYDGPDTAPVTGRVIPFARRRAERLSARERVGS